MIQLSINAKKELNRGEDQILGDRRIVMGIERDNHKEIENCQNQKKDEEIKVVDYSQFEASTKSAVHAEVNRIRKKDEIIRAVVKLFIVIHLHSGLQYTSAGVNYSRAHYRYGVQREWKKKEIPM